MNHPEEFTKTTHNHIVKWVLKERQHHCQANRVSSSNQLSLKYLVEAQLIIVGGGSIFWIHLCMNGLQGLVIGDKLLPDIFKRAILIASHEKKTQPMSN